MSQYLLLSHHYCFIPNTNWNILPDLDMNSSYKFIFQSYMSAITLGSFYFLYWLYYYFCVACGVCRTALLDHCYVPLYKRFCVPLVTEQTSTYIWLLFNFVLLVNFLRLVRHTYILTDETCINACTFMQILSIYMH